MVAKFTEDSYDRDNWRESAECLDANPDLFFPNGTTGIELAKAEKAKEYCARCAVSSQCLEYALTTGQDWGIWGGLTEEERRGRRASAKLQSRNAG